MGFFSNVFHCFRMLGNRNEIQSVVIETDCTMVRSLSVQKFCRITGFRVEKRLGITEDYTFHQKGKEFRAVSNLTCQRTANKQQREHRGPVSSCPCLHLTSGTSFMFLLAENQGLGNSSVTENSSCMHKALSLDHSTTKTKHVLPNTFPLQYTY